MTPEKARRVEAYIKRHGKDWTVAQVCAFYVLVAELSYPKASQERSE